MRQAPQLSPYYRTYNIYIYDIGGWVGGEMRKEERRKKGAGHTIQFLSTTVPETVMSASVAASSTRKFLWGALDLKNGPSCITYNIMQMS